MGRTPHISMHAYCETPTLAASMRRAASDRRLYRATSDIRLGGISAAIAHYRDNPTPDLLILESTAARDELLSDLTRLAPVCDSRTKVIVVGRSNDIGLFRELMSGGIAEYLIAPMDALTIIGAVLRLFPEENGTRIGKVHAVIGTKGGVGSSVLAQNLAWTVSRTTHATLLADLDLQFGTAALNCNIDCPTGFAEQLPDQGDRLDGALLERLLFKHGPGLSVLPCATRAQIASDPDLAIIEKVLDLARSTFPHVVLDLPHAWSPMVRSALLTADDITLVAEPDLANLRNARCLLDFLRQVRPNDPLPRLVINRVGMPRRKEIPPKKFASALEIPLAAKIDDDPVVFSAAAANGQMLCQVSRKAAVAPALECLARQLTGAAARKRRKGFWGFWAR
ncbi:AAA family ATPase [Natronohydrobacter thiooxidans]|uniref:AAA family ATPase n=1 Tax=Natronohydrobacter thiooxidans TaxID=87172 RepID=UPI001587DC88|nr:cellulose synthase operon protein YhjQ/BcsQ [Natronohydrobacter thiooxidans]